MGVLWAAHKGGAFSLPEMDQAQFVEAMKEFLSRFNIGWMIEDDNYKFGEKRGPVAIVLGVYNNWELEPQFFLFPWATGKNKLRCGVSFVQKARYSHDIGIVTIYDTGRRYWSKVRNYFMSPTTPKDKGVLGYVGRIPQGNVTKDRHIYFIRCRA